VRWDWTVLLLVDAAFLVAATLTVLALFARDLRRAARSADERTRPDQQRRV
jgi:hypothetical protein